jgi:plasmid stability protein
MGKNVQIRDVPEDVHRALRLRAAEAGVSLSEYLRTELKRLADRPPLAEVLRRARTRRGGAEASAIVEAVRSGRDA